MSVDDILKDLAIRWREPRRATHHGSETPFALACSFEPAELDELPTKETPSGVLELWRQRSWARLFVDVEYGQWGLVLGPPDRANTLTDQFKIHRARDYMNGDVVIGEFLGDSELLLARCDRERRDFGRILVARPLDARSDWPDVARDLESFLGEYARSEGAKFWE